MLDLASGGRFIVTGGIGYRPSEYEAHGKDWSKRGALQDEAIDTMLKAWTGEPFEYRGTTVQVTPRPFTQPHPVLMLGGSSKAAVRRAARFGLPVPAPGEPARARGLLLRAVRGVRHAGVLRHAAGAHGDDARRRGSRAGVARPRPPLPRTRRPRTRRGSPKARRRRCTRTRRPSTSCAPRGSTRWSRRPSSSTGCRRQGPPPRARSTRSSAACRSTRGGRSLRLYAEEVLPALG